MKLGKGKTLIPSDAPTDRTATAYFICGPVASELPFCFFVFAVSFKGFTSGGCSNPAPYASNSSSISSCSSFSVKHSDYDCHQMTHHPRTSHIHRYVMHIMQCIDMEDCAFGRLQLEKDVSVVIVSGSLSCMPCQQPVVNKLCHIIELYVLFYRLFLICVIVFVSSL